MLSRAYRWCLAAAIYAALWVLEDGNQTRMRLTLRRLVAEAER